MSEEYLFNKFVTKAIEIGDSDERTFTGYITAEIIDKQGEFIFVDEMMPIMEKFMNIKPVMSEVHTNRITGEVLGYSKSTVPEFPDIPAIKIDAKIFKADGVTLYDRVWKKIVDKEYKGLSIGGASRTREHFIKNGRPTVLLKDLELYEIAICFMKDTQILMADETQKSIQDIKIGDMVIGHDGKPHRVNKTFKNEYDGWIHTVRASGVSEGYGYTNEFRNGEVNCTPDHPFMMSNGTFKKIKDIKKGESVKTAYVVWNKGLFGHYYGKQEYDYIDWIRKSDSMDKNSVKLSSTKLNCTGKQTGFNHKGYVYNFDVEDTHTYVANGFVVHNCPEPANALAKIDWVNEFAKDVNGDTIKGTLQKRVIQCDNMQCLIGKGLDVDVDIDVDNKHPKQEKTRGKADVYKDLVNLQTKNKLLQLLQ